MFTPQFASTLLPGGGWVRMCHCSGGVMDVFSPVLHLDSVTIMGQNMMAR